MRPRRLAAKAAKGRQGFVEKIGGCAPSFTPSGLVPIPWTRFQAA